MLERVLAVLGRKLDPLRPFSAPDLYASAASNEVRARTHPDEAEPSPMLFAFRGLEQERGCAVVHFEEGREGGVEVC